VVDVTVTGPGGTSPTGAQDRFSYAPAVTSIAPTFGPASGGTTVTIDGNNLCKASAVLFGSVPAASFSFGKTAVGFPCTITAVSPPGTGVVDVTVTGPGGTSPTGAQDRFSYQ
jgi:hypothetical protein